jgi:putative nucleotidyltransferase with HDIG domain
MTRDDAFEILAAHIQSDSLRKHCLATEAIMCWLAPRFNADAELWGIAGLLHDLDFEATRDKPELHGVMTSEMLAQYALPREITDAIQRHNAETLQLRRESIIDFALSCAETITGLIVAAALVHPDRKIRQLSAKSVIKRMKSKDFARNVNREHIVLCERIGIPLAEFIQLSIDAMTSISDELGL